MGDNEFASGFLAGQGGGNNNGLDNGWGGIFGIIALLALANGGFGGWGGNGYNAGNVDQFSNALQTSILETSANQRELCNQFGMTNSNIINGNYQTQNAVTQWGMQNARDLTNAAAALNGNINSSTNDIKDRLWSLQQTQDNCCCATQRLIDGVNYNIAQQVGSIKEMLQQNKIEALQNQVNQLNLQAQLCGVVRYPNTISYNAGQSPFFNNNCCCGNM